MSARSFRSVFMVASCAGAALGCYLVSLRVASERAALEKVETEIVLAQRDIRLLQTEIGTRGRLAQLERWNVKVLALSAPSADQFLDGGFALAKMVTPHDKVALDAPVMLAAAPATGPKPQLDRASGSSGQPEEGVSASQMMHVASLKRATRPVAIVAPKVAPAAEQRTVPAKTPVVVKPSGAKPSVAEAAAVAKGPVVAKASAVGKTAVAKTAVVAKARPVTGKGKTAAVDPLAPVASGTKPKKLASSAPHSARKENGSKQ
jgi:hypothetical protein